MPNLAFLRKFPWSYGLAVLLCVAVWAFKMALETDIGMQTPFLLFFGAIMLATWGGGLGAGVFSTLLSVVLVDFFFLEPRQSFRMHSTGWIQVGVFVVEGFFIALLTSLARSTQDKFCVQVERQNSLAELSQLALVADNGDNLQPLFERAAQLGAATLDAPVVRLLELELTDNPTGEADFLVARGSSLPITRLTQRAPLALDSAAARVLQTGLPAGEITGELNVPIGAVERFWGVLQIGDGGGARVWTGAEIEWARAVANILGVAIAGQKARERVAQGETRYRSFVAQSSEAIWRIEMEDPLDLSLEQGELLRRAWDSAVLAECNDIFAQMYGFERAEEMIGMRLWQLMPRDDPRSLAYLREVLDSGFRLTDSESVEFNAQGQPRVFLNNLVGIIEGGQLLRVWGTQRDVTRERQAARELGESENRFRSLFDLAPVPLGIGRDDRVLYANGALTRLMGYERPGELIGAPITEFVAPDEREHIAARALNRAAGGEEPSVYETRPQRRDGSTFPARVQVTQIALPDGAATLMFLFDLTAQKRADTAIADLLENARRATARAQELQQISFELLQPRAPEEVARLAIERVTQVLGASGGVLMAPDDTRNPQLLQMLDVQGYPQGVLDPFFSIDVSSPHPIAHVFRSRHALWMDDALNWCDEFPALRQTLPRTGTRAVAIIPLEVEGRVNSVMALSFGEVRAFTPDQRLFLLTLANSCAQALERARLDAQTRELARSQRESLALLNTLLDSAPVGFALLDRDGRYILINHALADINGASIEDHMGKTTREMAPEKEFERHLQSVWESGQPSGEFILTDVGPAQISDQSSESAARDDAARRFCLVSLYPVRVRDEAGAGRSLIPRAGQILGVGAIVIDISERVRAEEEKSRLVDELETERARFETILQQMPSGVILGEAPSGRMLLSNPQADLVLGQSLALEGLEGLENSGKHPAFWPDGRRVEARDWPLARAIETGEIVAGEELMVPHRSAENGTDNRVVRITAAPIRNREGEITAGIAIIDDVTATARSAAAQRFLAEAGSALIATLDETTAHQRLAQLCVPTVADWCIIATPGAAGLLRDAWLAHGAGAAKEQLAERFHALLKVDARVPWDIAQVLQSGHARLYPRQNLADLERSGASAPYVELMRELGARSAIVAPLLARGRTFGVMIWISAESGRSYDALDVELADELARRAALNSDNARLLRESQQARDEAENANRTKDEFLAVVSHELRTPLTPILGWLDLLRAPGMTDELRAQGFDVIERNARAQAQLVNDILDVSRITSGKLRVSLKPLSLAELVRQTIASQRMVADDKGIEVQLDLADVGEAMLDETRFAQVVWNLFSNAIKFTPSGGRIAVTLGQNQNSVDTAVQGAATAQLEISDSGAGIAPEFLPAVFDAFRQADSSSTRKAGGLGLGLAIVRHIVERHGGSVSAHSMGEGQGATFRVEIPLLSNALVAPSAPQQVSSSGAAIQNITIRGAQILVVDDEADTRETLARLLEAQGARVRVAESAQAALQSLQDFEPQIVVSDIGMPHTDGYALLQQLRAQRPNLPALALTAYAAPADVERALSEGFARHLSKPVDIEALVTAIGELLRVNSP